MRQNRLDEAQAMLDEIERIRPDLARAEKELVTEIHPNGSSGWIPRSHIRGLWREFDALKWDLRDALEAERQD